MIKKLTINSIVSKKNRRRQEGFTPTDQAYLNSHKNVTLGKKIGEGCFGQVYEADNGDGNNDFVVKIPFQYPIIDKFEYDQLSASEKRRRTRVDEYAIRGEAINYKRFKGKEQPMLIPTKITKVNINGKKTIGLIRPKVTPIFDNMHNVSESGKLRMMKDKQRVTNSMLRNLYNKLVILTRQGYSFDDGLQLGIDKTGRVLVFDLGDVLQYSPSSNIPYHTNYKMWVRLLEHLDKTPSEIAKYSEITR